MSIKRIIYPRVPSLNYLSTILIEVKENKYCYVPDSFLDERYKRKQLGRIPLVDGYYGNFNLTHEGETLLECIYSNNKDGILSILSEIHVMPHFHILCFLIWEKEKITFKDNKYYINNKRLIDIILDLLKWRFSNCEISDGSGRYNHELPLIQLALDLDLMRTVGRDFLTINKTKNTIISDKFPREQYRNQLKKLIGG